MDRQEKALKRHRLVWRLMYYPLLLLARLLYNYSFSKAPGIKGPYIVLPNHTTGWDHYFVSFSFGMRHMYFLASEHAFRKPLASKLMSFLAGPISRVKGGADAQAAMAVLRWLKKGVSVCLFPEGSRTFNGRTARMHPATAKLLRAAGVAVVTYKITGGYLAEPRWAKTRRRGRVSGRVVNIYPPELIRQMSLEELNLLMERDLGEDAYETQAANPVRFRGPRLAEGIEEALFICPKCEGIGTLQSKGNRAWCGCGLKVEYDEYGYFDAASPFRTVAEWDDWQSEKLRELMKSEGELFGDGEASVWRLGENHNMSFVDGGRASLDRTGLRIGEAFFPLSEMAEPSLCHFSKFETLMFAARGGQYELRFGGKASRRKYCLMIILLQNELKGAGSE